MRILRIILRNLLRDKRRTLLTLASVSVVVVLLALLLTVRNTLDAAIKDPRAQRILALRERTAAESGSLPLSYAKDLAAIAGVDRVMPWSYVFTRVDPTHLMTGIAVDPISVGELMPPLVEGISAESLAAFAAERDAVLMGREAIQTFGWKVGDSVTLQGGSIAADFPVRIAGVLEFDLLADNFLMHHDYLEALAGDQAGANALFFRIPQEADVARVREEAERRFRGQPVEVEVITLFDFVSEVVSRSGDVGKLLLAMIAVVGVAALLMVANNLAMSARERTRQVAILRSLGFERRHVLWLVLGEAGLIALVASALGGAATYQLFHSTGFSLRMGAQSFFSVGGLTALESVGAGLAIGLLAGLGPALAALRTDVTETLRKVV